jgi:ribonuclease P protein subunit RPR2
MVRIAAERISALFALAEREARGDFPELADRYVRLARRIGMRYNVRLPPEYAEAYCRGCSRFWVEGRTVRTRLRSGRRVRTCLVCGRERRVPYGAAVRPGPAAIPAPQGLRWPGPPET